jgi:hypothetical protein
VDAMKPRRVVATSPPQAMVMEECDLLVINETLQLFRQAEKDQ